MATIQNTQVWKKNPILTSTILGEKNSSQNPTKAQATYTFFKE